MVVGNLPYQITSEILLRLFRYAAEVERAVVMVQREVADRLAAVPGTRDYGVLTVTTQMNARVEKLMTLPPEAFSPAPEVHSTVVRMTMGPRFAELGVGGGGVFEVCAELFRAEAEDAGEESAERGV